MGLLTTLLLLYFFQNTTNLFSDFLFLLLIILIILPFILSKVFKGFDYKKISSTIEWLILYIVLCLISYFGNYPLLFLFSIGIILKITLSFLYGEKVFLIHPFKAVNLKFKWQSFFKYFITIFLILYMFNNTISNSFSIFILISLSLFLSAIIMIFYDNIEALYNKIAFSFGYENNKDINMKKMNILLADLSPLWRRQDAVVSIKELSKSWLNDNQVKAEEYIFDFIHPEIIYFWENDIKGLYLSKAGKQVIGHILEYLDKFGDCPSVVSDQSKNYKLAHLDEKSTYNILYKRTLLEHSLQVAKEAIYNKDYKLYLEKLIISALGHDLGKILGHNNIKNYITGDHPKSSIYILETEIIGYKELHFYKEVSQIILYHHSNVGDKYPLIKMFKEIDSAARRYEIELYIKNQVIQEKEDTCESSNNSDFDTCEKEINEDNEVIQKDNIQINNNLHNDIITSTEEKNESVSKNISSKPNMYIPNFNIEPNVKYKKNEENNNLFSDLAIDTSSPTIINIEWFDYNLFLDEINRKINKIERGWFTAITVNGDIVLVLTTFAWKIIQSQARKNGIEDISSILDNEMNNDLKKSVLMSVVDLFKNIGFIDTAWIQDGYFNGKFDLIDDNKNKIRDGWYIPFKIEAFSKYNTYEEYEMRKKGDIAKITGVEVAGKTI